MIEKISRFLDDDLNHDDTMILLQTIKQQPELKDTLKRYAAISQALKTDDFVWVSDDFAARIQQEIQEISVDGLPKMNKERLN